MSLTFNCTPKTCVINVPKVEYRMEFEFFFKIRATGGKVFESEPFYLTVIKEIPGVIFHMVVDPEHTHSGDKIEVDVVTGRREIIILPGVKA